jgi:hypothetical protein
MKLFLILISTLLMYSCNDNATLKDDDWDKTDVQLKDSSTINTDSTINRSGTKDSTL